MDVPTGYINTQRQMAKLGMRRCSFFTMLLVMPFGVMCQVGYQDSLRNVIATSSSDEQKLNAWILLGLERNSLHGDSLQKYSKEVQKIAVVLHNDEALLEGLLMQGHVWNKKGESNAGIALADSLIAKEYSIPALMHKRRKFYLLKGFILNTINETRKAQETFFAVLKQAENTGDLFVQAAALNGIGWSYQNLNNNTAAIGWYKKGILLLHSISITNRPNRELMAVLHSNIGLAYYPLYKISGNKRFADTAKLYLDSAINTSRQNDFNGVLAISLGTKALLNYDESGDAPKAQNMLKEAINIRKKLGQLYFIITDMAKLSEMFYDSQDYQKSISISREAIRLADSSNIRSDIIYLHELLAKYLRANGQYKEYGDVLAIQIRIQDSINNANTAVSLNELSTKYEVQKKEVLIAKQQYNLLQRKIVIYAITICALAIMVIAFLKFLKYKKLQRNNLAAIKKEEKIKWEVESRLAKQRELERISADLHDDIGGTLSSMVIYSDLAGSVMDTQPQETKKMINKISGISKSLMERMGDIIWSMKPADEEKYTLEARLKNYSNEMLSPKGIVCEFNIDVQLAASITNPEIRKNILLIAKEAINNIAKYSQATQATITFHQQQQHVILIISDNGKGFNNSPLTNGNGLGNIKQRCKQLSGHCTIETSEGKGVTITCRFPIAIISHTG